MRSYASRTGTKQNLEALRRHGWRLLVSASGVWRCEGFAYGIDNGAWTAYQQGIEWDPRPFEELIELAGDEADFIVAPDIVGGGLESLERSLEWVQRLREYPQVLIPVQDGMTPDDVRPHVGRWVGIFIGGTTEWKWQTLAQWGALARETKVDCYLHVGRVNGQDKIERCAMAGAHSFDGTNPSRYVAHTAKLSRAVDRAERQLPLYGEMS
jgi:hypothetical protein